MDWKVDSVPSLV